MLLVLGSAASIALAFVLAREQGADDGDSGGDLLAPTDPGPIHVHGLGVNPRDRSLFIATHTGTYRVAAGEAKAVRVGEGRQDTMGFTVVGPDRFLGSGHPDPITMREQGLPPNLGLIESTDAGKTWTPISLLGEADFHVLRSSGTRVYGFDATNKRLLLSGDGGKTWGERRSPGALIDLAVNPARPSQLVAASVGGLFTSSDGARAWRALEPTIALLAWPSANRLYSVDGEGRVRVSGSAGAEWTPLGSVGGTPSAFLAHTATELYAALHDGTIKGSGDGGKTWEVRSAP